jgi:hypothetical protein
MSDRTDRTSRQALPRQGKRLRIFIGEAQEWQGKPLYQAILELAQRQGAAGATRCEELRDLARSTTSRATAYRTSLRIYR